VAVFVLHARKIPRLKKKRGGGGLETSPSFTVVTGGGRGRGEEGGGRGHLVVGFGEKGDALKRGGEGNGVADVLGGFRSREEGEKKEGGRGRGKKCGDNSSSSCWKRGNYSS